MIKQYAEKLSPLAPAVLRIMAGITFFAHGLGKVQNFAGNAPFMARLGVPLPEFFGALVGIK